MEKNVEALELALACHARLDGFRRERLRCKRYNYGDQWKDVIDVDGRRITEEQFIVEQGSWPLKNNLIRRLVRSVIGVYSAQSTEPRCVARDPAEQHLALAMTTLLRCNWEANRMQALYVRTLEEFLISGMAVHRKWCGVRGGRFDCWTDYVQPANFFVDSEMADFRGWDCRCIGEIHDIGLDDVLMRFGSSAQTCRDLRKVYAGARKCRVVELWRREVMGGYDCHDPLTARAFAASEAELPRIEAANAKRATLGQPQIAAKWRMREGWRYYFLTPEGLVLAQGDSPYAHGSHPYVVKIYPMIDGEVHSFVADVIDQQRYTNRLITMYDWVVRSSAKGVLLVPDECIPRGVGIDEFADAWSRFNGVIAYRPSMSGEGPRQVSSTAAHTGITDLLNMQLKFFEDISGVNSALEGRLASNGMSAALYGQQTQNATTALQDVLGTYAEFMREGAMMDISNMRQYYDDATVASIAGAGASIEGLRSIDFDLSLTPLSTTAASREQNNKLLLEIWRSGQITLEQMLAAGDFPFGDALRATDK